MKKQHTLMAAAVVALGMGIGVPVQADPRAWALADGHRAKKVKEYRYVYYPAQQLYYNTEKQVWFWMNGSGWHFGAHLPKQVRIDSAGVPVMLGVERPYVKHVYVEERYGRPWRERQQREKHKHRRHTRGHD